MHTFIEPILVDKSNWARVQADIKNHPIRQSKFSHLESGIHVHSISFKYVWEGKETYVINQKEHHLTNHQFVVVNHQNECTVRIGQQAFSQGICIDVEEHLLAEALQYMAQPNELDTDNAAIARFFGTAELFSQGTTAPASLKAILQNIANKKDIIYTKEFIILLTQEIIQSQTELIKQYNRLKTAKLSTKKELYHRLAKAKNLLADNPTQQSVMRQIAQEVCLSEFRFHHLFKQTFGLTAHQFQHQCLMQKALTLHQDHSSWTAVADALGYPDLPTFSKVFKKMYGVSPKYYERETA